MPNSKKNTKRDHYRHGNIPRAALKSARKLLDGGGVKSVSIRKIAIDIGVSPRALYNHFDGRTSLLAELAVQGFEELNEALRYAKSQQAFREAYLNFALEKSNVYALMMAQSYGSTRQYVSLGRAINHTISLSLAVFSEAGLGSTQNRHAVMREWMLLHGGVSLHLSGILNTRDDAQFIAEMKALSQTIPKT